MLARADKVSSAGWASLPTALCFANASWRVSAVVDPYRGDHLHACILDVCNVRSKRVLQSLSFFPLTCTISWIVHYEKELVER